MCLNIVYECAKGLLWILFSLGAMGKSLSKIALFFTKTVKNYEIMLKLLPIAPKIKKSQSKPLAHS